MTRSEFETWLDNELRNVPVPPELRGRLRRILASDDTGIDARLADVDLPPRLVHRLRDEVAGLAIDDRLRDVTIPQRLSRKLRRFVRRRAIAPLLSTAAAILILATSGLWLTTQDVAIMNELEPNERTTSGGSSGNVKSPIDGGPSSNSPNAAVVGTTSQSEAPSATSGSEAPARSEEAPRATGSRRPPSFDSELTHQALVEAGLVRDTSSPEHALGAPLPRITGARPLRTVPPLLARGGQIPLSRGFDRRFLLKHGVNPPVILAQDPQLAHSRVMLSSSVAAYERTRAELEAGRWPQAEDVQVEDFLATARYSMRAPPAGKLALFAHIGPSPFREGHHVLQIAVKAGDRVPSANGAKVPGSLLTVVVDLAPEMQYRLTEIQRALRRTVARMRNRDRLSVVMCAAEPTLALDCAARDDAAAWVDQLAGALSVDPQSNLVAAIELANRAIRKPVDISPENRRQVVISCSGRPLADAEVGKIEKALAELKHDRIGCLFVDVGVTEGAGEEAGLSSFDQVTRRAGLTLLRRSLSEPLYPLVDQWLPHRAQPVAHDVELAVKFESKTVLSYRLVGYEPSAGGVPLESQPGPLRAHDVASAVYELQLSDTDKGRIASIVVNWSDADHRPGTPLHRNLSQSHIAASDLESAPSLRLAALVAETAEVLRGSPLASMKRSQMQSLVDYAETLWPHIDAAANRELGALLQTATRVSTTAP